MSQYTIYISNTVYLELVIIVININNNDENNNRERWRTNMFACLKSMGIASIRHLCSLRVTMSPSLHTGATINNHLLNYASRAAYTGSARP